MSYSNMYQIENLVLGLLESINDKNPDVQQSVSESLRLLGASKADFILKTSLHFIQKNQLTDPHKTSIFNTAEKIAKENIENIEEAIALSWIEYAANEMIKNRDKDAPVALQNGCSSLLVAIGKRFVKEVFEQLQKNFSPGQLPHIFVLSTMASLAEVNPYGVVPTLVGVLASMLPMLGMAKLDSYKIVFATALCKFSEAILYYCSNIDKAPDKSIEISNFSTQIYAAHEIFFNVWIKTNDHKLKQITIETVGNFVNLMTHEKLEADIVKIITGLLALYKKHSDHFIISQSLYFTLKAGIASQPQIISIDTIFDVLVKEMFAQIIYGIELQQNKSTSPAQLSSLNKNQNELLRCYAELTIRYSDRMIPFLLQKFEQNNEKNRIASLNIIKHLINSCEEHMGNKKQLVISGVRILLTDPNPRVKKNLIQAIIAMGYHGYLGLEGGNLMIDFILKQCSLPDDVDKKQASQFGEDCSNESLKSASESILTLFSTTVENMHSNLWPSLLEYLVNIEYSRSVNVLCKNLAHIAENKRNSNSETFIIKYNELINIPRPYEILARLIVLVGVPLNNKNRGPSVLHLMKQLSPNIHASIIELWDNVTPKLIINIEDKLANSKFSNKTWEELILKFLLNTLDCINDEEIICEIARAFGKHVETLYANLSEEKHFAYKCLGIVLNKSTSKNTIDRQLDIVFNSVNHTNQHEREGCAISFGYCASNHLDTVLLKLETYAKSENKKSGGGLFSNILSSSNKVGDPDHIKATLVLSYGYVTFYAPKDLIISRLEANILRSVSGYASGPIKEVILKQNLLKSLDLITKCMHPDHLTKEFNFSYKTTLLNQIIAFITSENSKLLTTETKSICFKISSNIVKLNPKLSEADVFQLIKSVTDSFFPLQVPPPAVDDKKEKLVNVSQNEAENKETNDSLESTILHGNNLYEQTSKCLEDLLKTILDREATNEVLTSIFKHLEPWITSVNDHERLRSIRSLSSLLKHFASAFKEITSSESEKKDSLDCFGYILGRIISRSTDPVIQIRSLTISCIESLIQLQMLFNGEASNEQTAKEVEQLATIKQKLSKTDSNILLSAVSDLTKILVKQVSSGEQLTIFIERLIEGLLDVQSHCSSASCIFLNSCIKQRGSELKAQVDNLIRHLYTKLGLIQNPQAKLGTLRTIRILFQQHLIESLNVLLSFPIPCNNGEIYSNKSILIHEETIDYKKYIWLDYRFYSTMDMIDICQNLCEDSQLIYEIINHILLIWNRCLPYEEKNNVKYASLTPLIGTCILNEIFSNNTTANTEQVFNQNFEKIYSALFVRIASSLNNQMPFPKSKDDAEPSGKKDDSKSSNSIKPAVQAEYKKLDPNKISIDCFKSFIKCTQSYELFEYYENEKVWTLLSQETTHIDGYTILARGLCLYCDKYIKNIVDNLSIFLSAPYDCQKICVTAFYAELINHKCILEMVELLMNNLLTKLIDQCNTVRTLCIRGLGNMSSLGNEEVQKHSTTILSAMMAGLDDRDDLNDDITLESMIGLTKIIALIDENNVRPILINILLRIRPCFEKDKAAIRTNAYLLFGELARFGKGPSKDPYLEQIHSNFVNFILHLNEQDDKVKKACKHILKQIGPLIESNLVNDLFQSSLIDNKSLHYAEFINDLAKLLVNEFPEKVSFYIMNSISNFKSQWTEIRSNAVLFAGYLLGYLTKEKQSVLSKEHIANALIKLLKEDPAPLVRQKAAEAISLLPEF